MGKERAPERFHLLHLTSAPPMHRRILPSEPDARAAGGRDS